MNIMTNQKLNQMRESVNASDNHTARLLKTNIVDLCRFFSTHYMPTDDYKGAVILSRKAKGTKDEGKTCIMKNTHYFINGMEDLESAESVFKIMPKDLARHTDFYITPNAFTLQKKSEHILGNRNASHVFTLMNIVVDIDFHTKNRKRLDSAIETLMYNLEGSFQEPDFPCPNTTVFTGRGVQLWWRIDDLAKKKYSDIYDSLAKWLMDRCEDITKLPSMKQYGASVDHSASGSIGGLVRLPLSYNTKADCRGSFKIYHEDTLDGISYYFDYIKPEVKTTHRNPNMMKSDVWAASRKKMIYNLMYLRKHGTLPRDLAAAMKETYDMTGLRDNACFVLFNACLTSHMGTADAFDEIDKLNEHFTDPLTKGQLRSFMSTSCKKPYNLSNGKIIGYLQITEEEQEMLNFRSREAYKKEMAAKRKDRLDKIQKVFELFESGQGYSQTAIAKMTGFSQPQVSRFLKMGKEKALTPPTKNRPTKKEMEARRKEQGENTIHNNKEKTVKKASGKRYTPYETTEEKHPAKKDFPDVIKKAMEQKPFSLLDDRFAQEKPQEHEFVVCHRKDGTFQYIYPESYNYFAAKLKQEAARRPSNKGGVRRLTGVSIVPIHDKQLDIDSPGGGARPGPSARVG